MQFRALATRARRSLLMHTPHTTQHTSHTHSADRQYSLCTHAVHRCAALRVRFDRAFGMQYPRRMMMILMMMRDARRPHFSASPISRRIYEYIRVYARYRRATIVAAATAHNANIAQRAVCIWCHYNTNVIGCCVRQALLTMDLINDINHHRHHHGQHNIMMGLTKCPQIVQYL